MQWNDEDTAFEDVARGIQKVVEDFSLRGVPYRSPSLSSSSSPVSSGRLRNTSPLTRRVKTTRRRAIALLTALGVSVGGAGFAWFTISRRTGKSMFVSTPSLSPTSFGKGEQANTTTTPRPTAGVPGRTWHTQSSGTTAILRSITRSSSQFVVVGSVGTILTSSDGRIWIAQNSNTSFDLQDVIWSGSQFVVVEYYTDILTSADGRVWTAQKPSTIQRLLGVAWSGSQFVAVGEYGAILTSSNGRIWTAQNSNTLNDLQGVAWLGSQFITVGGKGTILSSSNGNDWFVQQSPTSQFLWSVAWTGSQFVALGAGGTILTSLNGRAWIPQKSGTSDDLWKIIWSGSQFVAVGWYYPHLTLTIVFRYSMNLAKAPLILCC